MAAKDNFAQPCDAVDDSAKMFRFLDLPAELRNRIYSYNLTRCGGDILDFRIPSITRVSRQTRKEALPILFAENHFSFMVSSRVASFRGATRGHSRTSFSRWGDHDGSAGTIELHPVVEKFLRTAAEMKADLFKDIMIRAYKCQDLHVARKEERGETKLPITSRPWAFVHINIHVEGSKADIAVET